MALLPCLPSQFPCSPVTGFVRLPLLSSRRSSKGVQSSNYRFRCCINTGTSVSQPLRRAASYPQNIWDDSYIQALNCGYMGDEQVNEIRKLKEEVRQLFSDSKEILYQIELIDELQQLGVAYHFQDEIKDKLSTIFFSLEKTRLFMDNDLKATSLIFRLLREHGFHLSADIFNSFREDEGNFKLCLKNDMEGMLSLYEASFLAIEGDNQLDEARMFATEHLKHLSESLVEASLRERVAHALELPLHWRMPRLHTRWFIDCYEKKVDMNSKLCRLAKLDFNFVQSIYKRELKELSRWWTNLGLGQKLNFARDRLVENYLFVIGWAFEPKLWQNREAMTMANCLVTTLDDIYDIYGSLDELELFTDAVNRWDAEAIEQLPDYMKTCIMALFNTTNLTAYKIMHTKGVNIIPQLRRSWADLCKAYLVEAKWYHSGYMPTLEEYLDTAWISISGPLVLTQAYCTSENITDEALKCYNFYPDVVRQSSMISRLWNDLATSTAEMERGDVPKSIQCYMHEKGVSEEVAREYIRDIIVSISKKFDYDCISNSSIAESLKSVALDVHRMSQCVYQYEDGYGEQGHQKREQVISLLIEPIPL
uniref:Linalool synthase n=1 Tax=Freesia hybrid cultivar TaxID=867926 RepID=A0A1Q1N939_9ASPA|nr:linalool synthase [Freesia hybrid cultivar]